MPVTAGDRVLAGTYVCMGCGDERRVLLDARLERCERCGNGHFRMADEEPPPRPSPGRRFGR